MRNALTLAGKELRGYFASPIAYIVMGFYALPFGFMFYTALAIFDQQSMQFAGLGGGAPAMNVNDQLIRPSYLNVMVIFLFLLPLITMRTYAEEKRSGTIELLLTSPLSDWEIITGKFLGAMGMYAAMLSVTIIHVGLLFRFGSPEVLPILTTYLGLLLMGGCFVSLGLLISSLTSNQIVAAAATFGIFLTFWIIDWVATFTGPTTREVLEYLSIIRHLDDFTRGIIDTQHVVYYLSFIAFGLFLTARSVDTERWRG